jgi:hypothetical protein
MVSLVALAAGCSKTDTAQARGRDLTAKPVEAGRWPPWTR